MITILVVQFQLYALSCFVNTGYIWPNIVTGRLTGHELLSNPKIFWILNIITLSSGTVKRLDTFESRYFAWRVLFNDFSILQESDGNWTHQGLLKILSAKDLLERIFLSLIGHSDLETVVWTYRMYGGLTVCMVFLYIW